MSRKSLPPLKTLPAFVATAQHLSFSKAAGALFVTHSAVSQSIKLLEGFLGTKLFKRQAGKVSLTNAGSQYYAAINSALNTIEHATRQQLGQVENRVLTVNVMTTLAMRWLIPRLPDFQAKYPQIDLRLSTLTTAINFVSDKVDIAITYGHADDWPGLHVDKLFDDALVLVVNSKLTDGTAKVEDIISKFKCIYVSSELRKYDWQLWCAYHNIKSPSKNNRIYFSSSAQALQAVANSMGVMVTHEPFIVDDLKSGQLVRLADAVAVDKNIYLTYPTSKSQDKKTNKFCHWILNSL